jgi:hypothetical protein
LAIITKYVLVCDLIELNNFAVIVYENLIVL